MKINEKSKDGSQLDHHVEHIVEVITRRCSAARGNDTVHDLQMSSAADRQQFCDSLNDSLNHGIDI